MSTPEHIGARSPLIRAPRVTVDLEDNTLVFDETGPCAVVSRAGTNPFRQPYECADEAWSFYKRLVHAAYERAPETLREVSP